MKKFETLKVELKHSKNRTLIEVKQVQTWFERILGIKHGVRQFVGTQHIWHEITSLSFRECSYDESKWLGGIESKYEYDLEQQKKNPQTSIHRDNQLGKLLK